MPWYCPWYAAAYPYLFWVKGDPSTRIVYELLLPVKSKIFTEKRNTCLTVKYVFMICYGVGHTLFIDNQYLFVTY